MRRAAKTTESSQEVQFQTWDLLPMALCSRRALSVCSVSGPRSTYSQQIQGPCSVLSSWLCASEHSNSSLPSCCCGSERPQGSKQLHPALPELDGVEEAWMGLELGFEGWIGVSQVER